MADFDLFELTSLTFDPPEKNPKSVKTAIENAINELDKFSGNDGSNGSNPKRDFLTQMLDVVLQSDKLTPKFTELAEEKREKQSKLLEKIIQKEKEGNPHPTVTSGMIKYQKNSLRLAQKTVEELYKKYGFEVIVIDLKKHLPKFPTAADKAHKLLAQLRKTVDPRPNALPTAKNETMYDFCAYVRGEPEKGQSYIGKTAAELSKLLSSYQTANAQRQDTLGHLCNDIASLGSTGIFISAETKMQYDKYLIYHSKGLEETFEIIRGMPPSKKTEPQFAEKMIAEITKYFQDSDTALAIYNKEAGIIDNPYLPTVASFTVVCGFCKSASTFSDVKAAHSVNQCQQCKKPLFKKCLKCGELVLASEHICPACFFNFTEADRLDEYIALTEQALSHGDLDQASSFLLKAKSANPAQSGKLAALQKRLEDEEKKYAAPINQLKSLIAGKKFSEAQSYVSTVLRQYPSLNISAYESQIHTVMAQCSQKYQHMNRADTAACINTCMDIVELCVDFSGAVDYLRAHPPKPCAGLAVSSDDERATLTLRWSNSAERGVKYIVCRKDGKKPPQSVQDGKKLSGELADLSFTDRAVIPGKQYAYSVFAVRLGVFAPAASVTGYVLKKVTDVSAIQQQDMLHLTWKLPENCSGVRIVKKLGGSETVLAERAHNSQDDKVLSYNKEHVYLLSAVYEEFGQSAPVRFSFVPTQMIQAFSITVKHNPPKSCEVRWTIAESGVDMQIMVNGIAAERTRSDLKSCKLDLQPNQFYKISARAFSGGQWVESTNTCTVNTYCSSDFNAKIDEKPENSAQSGGAGKITLTLMLSGTFQPNATDILFFVRTKQDKDSAAPWVTEEEAAKATDGHRMSVQTYRQKSKIELSFDALQEEKYYITLFILYQVNGSTVISSPMKRTAARPLEADIFWSVKKGFLFGNPVLHLDMRANHPFSVRPALTLCVSKNGELLNSKDDSASRIVAEIPEAELDPAKNCQTEAIPIKGKIEKGEKLFLFLSEGGTIGVRWAKGFNGKL